MGNQMGENKLIKLSSMKRRTIWKKIPHLSFLFVLLLAQYACSQKKEAIDLSGYVIGYDSKTSCGCFYVDKEMVEVGVAKDISDKVTKSCKSSKYGYGALINFKQVPPKSDYTKPAENTLIITHGYWTVKDGKNTFIVTSFEPFF